MTINYLVWIVILDLVLKSKILIWIRIVVYIWIIIKMIDHHLQKGLLQVALDTSAPPPSTEAAVPSKEIKGNQNFKLENQVK